MPGPFTHVYTARRVTDFLASDAITGDFIRPGDDALAAVQKLFPGLVDELDPKVCAERFFFLSDRRSHRPPVLDARQAFAELANDLLALAAEEILGEGDAFGWFSLKMRQGFDEQAFLRSDMTHSRRNFVCTCYHPPSAVCVQRMRDLERCALRPGNVHIRPTVD